jgi:sec-independent protein translocase protein TatA
MGDVAKGIKSFKKGMADDEDDATPAKPATRIEGHRVPEQDAPSATEEKTKA